MLSRHVNGLNFHCLLFFAYFEENVENKDHFWIKAEMSEPEETKEPQPGKNGVTLKKLTILLKLS